MTPFYEQDGVTIYHGDCRDVIPTLPGRPDLVIADPPYGETSLQWDRWPEGWPATIGLGCSMWCFGSMRMFLSRACELDLAEWSMSQDVVWEKHNGSGFASDRFRRVHELILHFYRGPWEGIYHQTPRVRRAGPRKSIRSRGHTPHTGAVGNVGYVDDGLRLVRSVISVPSMQGKAENETQKPEAIVGPLIEYGCPPGGLVVSPFMGSGTDLVVAKMMGRLAIGIDSREQQCEKAAKRLAQGALPLEMGA